jgi:SAM-dependent methyltransferase
MRTVWDEKWEYLSANASKNTMLDTLSGSVYFPLLKLIKTSNFPSSRICGVDISEASIDLCKKARAERKTHNVDFLAMDANELKFRDGEFDLVFSEGVIHHFKDALKPVKEMMRVTKKGGSVIATVANWYNFPHTINKALKGEQYEYGYERSYKHREIRALFENAGLTNIEILGAAPSYGMRRINGHPLLGGLITRLIEFTEFIVDRSLNNRFSDKFGFQLIVKGAK